MLLEVNSGHTSSQANEPLLCPLFNMDVTPAGYSLSHCENYFSIKMQKLELCPGKAAKNTALWGIYDRGLSGYLPHPSFPRKAPPPAGSLLRTFDPGLSWPCQEEKALVPVPLLQIGKLRSLRSIYKVTQGVRECSPSSREEKEAPTCTQAFTVCPSLYPLSCPTSERTMKHEPLSSPPGG